MELSNESCTVLGRDSAENIVVRYSLVEFPTIRWTKLFNRIISVVIIKSIINSKSIIVIADPNILSNLDVASVIREKIIKSNSELNSDVLKNEIILDNFIIGLIVVHNDMGYHTDENSERKSKYELYLLSIIERMQEHDEYEDMLNDNLGAV